MSHMVFQSSILNLSFWALNDKTRSSSHYKKLTNDMRPATRLLFDLPPFLSDGFLQSSLEFTQQFFRLELHVCTGYSGYSLLKNKWSRTKNTKNGSKCSTRNLLWRPRKLCKENQGDENVRLEWGTTYVSMYIYYMRTLYYMYFIIYTDPVAFVPSKR